jgi:hypothetical protein
MIVRKTLGFDLPYQIEPIMNKDKTSILLIRIQVLRVT